LIYMGSNTKRTDKGRYLLQDLDSNGMERSLLRKKRFLVALLITLTILVVLSFLAPLTLPPDSVRLEGSGEVLCLNNYDGWKSLPVPHKVLYIIGDGICHQDPDRSFFLNGNQMPVCARDVGIFLGFMLGLTIAILFDRGRPAEVTIHGIVGRIHRTRIPPKRLTMILGIVFIAPVVIDGALQLVTPYESTNVTRLLTGMSGAGFLSLWVALILEF